jgi:hypothetical protein
MEPVQYNFGKLQINNRKNKQYVQRLPNEITLSKPWTHGLPRAIPEFKVNSLDLLPTPVGLWTESFKLKLFPGRSELGAKLRPLARPPEFEPPASKLENHKDIARDLVGREFAHDLWNQDLRSSTLNKLLLDPHWQISELESLFLFCQTFSISGAEVGKINSKQ